MFVPYMTIGEDFEVAHSVLNGESDKRVIVDFEKPDPIFGFKTAQISIPNYTIEKRYGFTDKEMRFIIDFCQNNEKSIIEYAKVGGISNA